VLVARRDVPVEQVTRLGAEFIEWDVAPRGANPLRELKALRDLARLYRTLAPDLVFHFTIKPVIYGAIAARLAHAPFVSVITGLGYLFLDGGWKSSAAKALYRWTLHASKEVWFLNADDRRFFDAARLTDGLHVRTLPGEGVDMQRFAPVPPPASDDPFVFLMVARLVRDKGVFEFAQAAEIVRRSHPRAAFRLLGPAYLAKGMSVPPQMLQRWSADGVLDYLGAADDVRPAIAASHCVVLPSYREGMPRVLMEAAAMGRPAIATDVTGCRDVVVAGQTGLLCAAQDAASLARACIEMMSLGPQRLARMAEEAHQQAARFDDRAIVAIYEQVVDSVGPDGAGRPAEGGPAMAAGSGRARDAGR
jgi:glycosyltransferase involved in cell wall biosynthesis